MTAWTSDELAKIGAAEELAPPVQDGGHAFEPRSA